MSSARVIAIIVSTVVVALLVLAWLYVNGDAVYRTEILKEVAKALLQLVLIGVFAMYARHILEQHVADQRRQSEIAERRRTANAALHASRIEVLNAITSSYWGIKKSLHVIDAHRSARSYGQQMRQIIDFRLQLQQVNNEISAGMYELVKHKEIAGQLRQIDNLLESLMEEWKQHYFRLSHLQKEDEKQGDPELRKVPREIEALPELKAIRECKFKAIHAPFTAAVEPIRAELGWHAAPANSQSDAVPFTRIAVK